MLASADPICRSSGLFSCRDPSNGHAPRHQFLFMTCSRCFVRERHFGLDNFTRTCMERKRGGRPYCLLRRCSELVCDISQNCELGQSLRRLRTYTAGHPELWYIARLLMSTLAASALFLFHHVDAPSLHGSERRRPFTAALPLLSA